MNIGLFKKRRGRRSADYVEISAAEGNALVDELGSAVLAIMDRIEHPRDIRLALIAGLPLITQRDLSEEALVAGEHMAELGWATRSVELARFEAAHQMDLELAERLVLHLDTEEPLVKVVTAFAAHLVVSEPPYPTVEQGGPLWSIPAGLGGQLRLAVAAEVMDLSHLPPDVGPLDMLAAWKFGFYFRVMDEFFWDDEASQDELRTSQG